MWRALDCKGSGSSDAIIHAMLDAAQTKPDIISMSIGGSQSWSEDPQAVVAERIVASGILGMYASQQSRSLSKRLSDLTSL